MWELDCEESWVPKNWCFWTVVLEKTLESPLNCKEIQPVHCEGDQPWDFFGRNDAKAETPVLWPPHAKSWLIGKDSDAGRDWEQEEKGTSEDEKAGWHHQPDGHEFGWTLEVGDGRGVLACWNMGSQRVGHDWVTELNWTNGGIIMAPVLRKVKFFFSNLEKLAQVKVVLLVTEMSYFLYLEKCIFRPSTQLLIGLVFWYWVAWCVCIFWLLILCQLLHLQIFSAIMRAVFSSSLWFPLLCKAFEFS